MNIIDTNTRLPFYRTDFKKQELKVKSDQDLIYQFSIETTGSFGDRKAYMTAGYKGEDDLTNTFVVDLETLNKLKDSLDKVITEINEDLKKKNELSELHELLESYIIKGYVEKIKVSKLKHYIKLNGFNTTLYSPYKIEPIFKKEVLNNDIDDNIIIGLNWVEFLHFSINEKEFENTLGYIRCEHKEIPIEFDGYDRQKEIKDHIKESMKGLKDYDPSRKPTKDEIDKAKNIMKELGYEFPIIK